ncbi:beta-galactosidase [Arthrobacter sp. PvP102]|uniref:beta-galactosidase n=1 Tax=unclassified Arthrobacter TaxID=235627 RepID=UPI001AE6312B|nr:MULTISPECIES: beta-galactosidase [unclassified Arthrobacter]MBP1234445.1 beta-galactosidase [Arthrobacter sp. PvP103]MBP1239579.1 beta-galactosidase [Arthrobacter sp. PvP102]
MTISTDARTAEERLRRMHERLGGIAYGGDYNPEQWPREVWLEDVRLMKEAGVNLVTLAVFSWSRLETADGVYDFGWLDDVMDLMHQHGIGVDLATPDAVPPAWLIARHPDILPVLTDGTTFGFGSRQHFDVSHPVYREKALAIAERMGEHYAKHPALMMWHVGNEYGPVSYGPWADKAFRAWLQAKYPSLAELNQAWSTDVWGQVYSDWNQVGAPAQPRTWSNPTRRLDYHRFTSHSMLEHYKAERDILRRHTPDLPIVTNFMRFYKTNDYWAWAAEEDAAALDIYPDPRESDAHVAAALNFDLMRSLRGGQPWMVMEQATGAVSQWSVNVSKLPGKMRLGSYQAIAQGADAILFFQWRQARGGTERYHSGMVNHAGPNTRIFREVTQLGNELKELGTITGTRSTAKAAIVFDWDCWWALELGNSPRSDLNYAQEVLRFYRPLFDANITVDFVDGRSDLSTYSLVILPATYLLTDAAARRFEDYVSDGGRLVVSYLSGIVDESNTIRLGGYPGALRKVLGAWSEEMHPLAGEGEEVKLETADGGTASASYWTEHVHTETAEVLATYESGRLAGSPAVTRNSFGKGTAVYLSARVDDTFLEALLATEREASGVHPELAAPPGVQVRRRSGKDSSFLLVLNHNDAPVNVDVGRGGTDRLSGRPVEGSVELAANGVLVLQESGATADAADETSR